MTINVDDTPDNADWHTNAWNLPTDPVALIQLLNRLGVPIADFEQMTVYRANVSKLPWLRNLHELANHTKQEE